MTDNTAIAIILPPEVEAIAKQVSAEKRAEVIRMPDKTSTTTVKVTFK
jgi:hypothetical protein